MRPVENEVMGNALKQSHHLIVGFLKTLTDNAAFSLIY